ncbi:MAG: hypothetical protein OEY36_05390 [Gammaproteobacteria bacterium]|nr:hypothetical protein [Gammaproteobacteria bacterium]
MDVNFFSIAVLSEIILLLVIWIVFLHWRISKNKKNSLPDDENGTPEEADVTDPFEIYLQFINRELTETLIHLDDLKENHQDDFETINMYEYRLKHLNAEQKAMAEAQGDTARFWELYRASIEFVYQQPAEPEAEPEANDLFEDIKNDLASKTNTVADTADMEDQLEAYRANSTALMDQNNDVIGLIQKFAETNDSAELSHMLVLLRSERDLLAERLQAMEDKYLEMLHTPVLLEKAPRETLASEIERNLHNERVDMSKILSQQNARVSELNDIVGNLSLELEEKKQLVKETDWVTGQLRETEQVVIILEDENSFLRSQIKELLERQ